MKKLWKHLGTAAFWLGWLGIYAYLRFGKRTKLLVRHKDQVLLVKNWLGPDEWSLPGGGIRLGEEPLEAALRELREETEIQLTSSDLKLVSKSLLKTHGLKFISYVYEANLPKLPKTSAHGMDITEAAWFNRQELASQRLSPEVRNLLS